jgi:hypothetical protein
MQLCSTACIALEVFSNNLVRGYVNGGTGSSAVDPSTRIIDTFDVVSNVLCDSKILVSNVETSNVTQAFYYVDGPQVYTLTNCVIDAGGSAVDGYISGDACIGGTFKALAANTIPPACLHANVSCVSGYDT